MGGLAGFYEEVREAVLNNGFDDPILGWRSTSNAGGYCFSLYAQESKPLKEKKVIPKRQTYFTTKNVAEEIATCKSLLRLCMKQEMAVSAFYDIREPRSKSFEYWLGVAADSIAHKKHMLLDHLSEIQTTKTSSLDLPDFNVPVYSRVLEYLIKHIIEDELKYQTANRTELINIIDDATCYISEVEGLPLIKDGTNSIWLNYLKSHYSFAIRDDHCCGQCGSDLFVGIPYCLSCNTLLSR